MPGVVVDFTLNDKASPSLEKVIKLLTSIDNTLKAIQADSKKVNTILENTEKTNRKLLDIEKKIKVATDNNSRAQQHHNEYLRGATNEANRLLNALRNVVSVYALYNGAKNTVALADTVAQTRARLGIVNEINGGLETSAELEQKIYEASMRSRANYQDMASVIGKMGMVTGDVFSSMDELIGFTETINKMGVISGAGTQEISSALLQIKQAMGSGIFQGDEFKSVSENLPMAMDAVEKYLGKTNAEVRKLSKEGKITASVFKNAIFAAAAETEERFKKMAVTWGQVWNMMKNHMLKVSMPILQSISDITQSERFVGFMQKLSVKFQQFMGVVADVFEKLKKIAAYMYDNWSKTKPIILGVATAFAIYKVAVNSALIASALFTYYQTVMRARAKRVAGTIFAVRAQLYGMNAAMMSCPWAWLLGGLALLGGVIISTMVATYDWESANIDVWGTVKNVARAAIGVIKSAWQSLCEYLQPTIDAIREAFNNFSEWVVKNWDKISYCVAVVGGVFVWIGQVALTVATWIVKSLVVVWDVLCFVLDLVKSVGEFIVDNWGYIEPIIFGIVGAFVAYKTALIAIAAWHAISAAATALWKGVVWAAKGVMSLFTAATWKQIYANIAMTVSGWAASSPLLFWIIVITAIIVLIALLIKWIASWCGKSVSAIGIITGAFMYMYACIYNVIALLWNYISAFVEFFANVFKNPTYSVKMLFINLGLAIVGMAKGTADAFDAVANAIVDAIEWCVNKCIGLINSFISALPSKAKDFLGVSSIGKVSFGKIDFKSNLGDLESKLNAMKGTKPEDYWEAPKMEYKDTLASLNSGYDWGANLTDNLSELGGGVASNISNLTSKLGDLVKSSDGVSGATDDLTKALTGGYDGNNPALDKIGKDTDEIAKNTGSLDGTSEDTKYLRELAHREAINKYTLTDLNVNMTNNNNIASDVDADNVMNRMYGVFANLVGGTHGKRYAINAR